MISSTLRSASAVRPGGDERPVERAQRLDDPEPVVDPAEAGECLLAQDPSLVDVARPQPDAGLQVEHHRRAPLVAPAVGLGEHELGELLGLGVAAPEVVDVGEQTARAHVTPLRSPSCSNDSIDDCSRRCDSAWSPARNDTQARCCCTHARPRRSPTCGVHASASLRNHSASPSEPPNTSANPAP